MTDFKLDHPDGVVLALDQMSVYLQSSLCRVWSVMGQTPVVRSSPQRDSLKFYGALDVERGTEIALTLPKMNGENTIHFLHHILSCIPDVSILLLWDRATWHKGIARQFVEDHERLDMLYFPPACPDLNPQEHVWKQARDEVGHLHDYSGLGDLRQAFQNFLEQTPFCFQWIEKYFPILSYTSVDLHPILWTEEMSNTIRSRRSKQWQRKIRSILKNLNAKCWRWQPSLM